MIAPLKLHGIRCETIDAPRMIALDMVHITEPSYGGYINYTQPQHQTSPRTLGTPS